MSRCRLSLALRHLSRRAERKMLAIYYRRRRIHRSTRARLSVLFLRDLRRKERRTTVQIDVRRFAGGSIPRIDRATRSRSRSANVHVCPRARARENLEANERISGKASRSREDRIGKPPRDGHFRDVSLIADASRRKKRAAVRLDVGDSN